MGNDQVLGWGILLGSVAGVACYFWLVFIAPEVWRVLTIRISAFAAVAAVLVIVAWIGYTLATTPPPMPLEDLDFESEIEAETTEEESS